MTIRDLITKLQEFDQDKEVWILADDLPAASEPDVRVVNNWDSAYHGVKEGSICIY